MKPYFIDEKPAVGEDYATAIDALTKDDFGFLLVKVPDTGTLMVSTSPGGLQVTDERLDGSSWTSPVLSPDRAKNLVALFLNGREDWGQDVDWDLTILSTKDARRRTLRVVLIGAVIVALAAWLARHFLK